LARERGISLASWFGGSSSEIETDLTLSAGPAPDAAKAAREAAREGFRQFKVKVGTGAGDDWERVAAVWNAVGQDPAVRLLLDGNQGMTPRSALELVERCLGLGMRISLLEQPLPAGRLKEAARLKMLCPVPLAADESVRSAGDALRVLMTDAADVLNVKIAKTGLQESLDIIALAKAAGKRLMIGCMQETARGLSASVHLACGTGAFDFVDLDSDRLLGPGQPQGDFQREGACVRLTGGRD